MHDRAYRFLIPPVLLVVYIAAAFALVNKPVVDLPKNIILEIVQFLNLGGKQEASLVGALFAGGVLILTGGVLIGTATTIYLHALHWICEKGGKTSVYHTVIYNDNTVRRFLNSIGHPPEKTVLPAQKLRTVASNLFLHGVCNEGIEAFLDRRWNTFVMSANCAAAGAFALFFVWAHNVVHESWPHILSFAGWNLGIVLLSGAFLYLGCVARTDILDAATVATRSPGLWRIERP